MKPRTRREQWTEHLKCVKAQIEASPRMTGILERMLERDRQDCIDGRFPWQGQLEGRPTDDEIKQAIDQCITENGGKCPDRDELWASIQAKFPGDEIRRKLIRELMPRRPPGRPPES
jgi:hypothetical protein